MPHLNPKSNFQKSRLVRPHADLAVSADFNLTLESALAQYALNVPTAPDMATAAANHWRMVGAREFIHVLLNLSEPPGEKPKQPRQNLV